MKVYRAPKKAAWLWLIRISIVLSVMVAILKLFHVKQNFAFMATVATIGISVAAVFYILVYAKNYAIEVTGRAIIVKNGVIIKKERILPSPRLIFAESYELPIERVLKLKTLAFRAVNQRLFTLPLDIKDAEEILKEISENKQH